jgi:hypothetical protein
LARGRPGALRRRGPRESDAAPHVEEEEREDEVDRPGEHTRDADVPAPPGRYMVTAGLYDPALGYRWPLSTGGPDVTGRREYKVAEVEALPGRSADARFHLTGAWSSAESGGGRQVPGRRSLSESGSLEIEASPAPRTVRLGMRVEPLAGAAAVTGTCPVSADKLLEGFSWLEASPLPGQPCEIRFEKMPPSPADKWLSVEVVAFRRQ